MWGCVCRQRISIFDKITTKSAVSSKLNCKSKYYLLLATTSVLNKGNKTSVKKLTRSSKLFKNILEAVQSKKAENIISLDLRKIPEAAADFFIICQATSSIQIKAIADAVEDQVKFICNENPFKKEGFQALQWVLIDYVNIVVHIMHPEARKFYRLEEMWSDAEIVEHIDN